MPVIPLGSLKLLRRHFGPVIYFFFLKKRKIIKNNFFNTIIPKFILLKGSYRK